MSERRFPKSVLQFESLSAFLSEYYAFKKSIQPRFSYEAWARALGAMNRSLLKQIVDGIRSLPETRTGDLIKYFKLNAEEKRHFLDLVALAGGEAHKPPLQKKVRARVSYHQDLYVIEEVEKFLETPEIPVLATLLTFKDLPKDMEALSQIMNVKVTTLEKWFNVLENLGFIKRSSEGSWKNTKNSFRIPSQLGQESLLNFHRRSLERAIAGLNEPKEERYYEAMLVAMSPEEYQEYLVMLNEFRADVLGRFNAGSLKGRHLFQVNMAISPAVRIPTLEAGR